jgi:propanol-preferring alcohol dehydrogenase
MSDIPTMSCRLLWEEREVVSVANLTHLDAEEFFPVARAALTRARRSSAASAVSSSTRSD